MSKIKQAIIEEAHVMHDDEYAVDCPFCDKEQMQHYHVTVAITRNPNESEQELGEYVARVAEAALVRVVYA